MYQPSSNAPQQPQGTVIDLVRWAGAVIAWVSSEFRNIAAEFTAARPTVKFKRLYSNPARIEADTIAVLDATHPDASLGEGLYIRNAANTAWSKV